MKSGITLVELLIAVSVFAFIIASSYLLLRGFNRMYSRGVTQAEYRESLRLVSRIFSKDIASMYLRCEGTDKSLDFLSLRVRGDKFHLSEIHYRIDGDKIYRAMEIDTDYNFSTRGEEELLTDGISDGSFSYYSNGWSSSWNGSELPSQVRLKISWKMIKRSSEFTFKVMSQ